VVQLLNPPRDRLSPAWTSTVQLVQQEAVIRSPSLNTVNGIDESR
jgi:hypothetical protein